MQHEMGIVSKSADDHIEHVGQATTKDVHCVTLVRASRGRVDGHSGGVAMALTWLTRLVAD